MAKRKPPRVPRTEAVRYDVFRVTADGSELLIEQARCGKCGRQFPNELVDPDDASAWPDEDTWLCENCR